MELLQSFNVNTKKDIYMMTQSPKALSIKDMEDGDTLDVRMWQFYIAPQVQDGEKKNVHLLSVSDGQNVYTTNSPTFQEDFGKILDIMEDEPFAIEKISGTSKAGRQFVTCALV